MPQKISIVEVGPRDGLQNEVTFLSVPARVGFIRRLLKAGLRRVEIGAFVSPKWVPQMADSLLIAQKVLQLQKKGVLPADAVFSTLVPNSRGMEDALKSGIKEIAIFTAASEAFAKKNINSTIEQSLQNFQDVVKTAKANKVRVRAYVSTCFYCPYTGFVEPRKVVHVVEKLKALGCYEISIGDTIGAATPNEVRRLIKDLNSAIGIQSLAMHFHDTRGTALANILASLDLGITTFDASLGGLGGCPYAPGAAGNVATEDVVYMMNQMGLSTGVDLAALIKVNKWMATQVGRELPARVSKAGLPFRSAR